MPRGAFSISMDPADAIHEIYQMAALVLWLCCDSGCLTGVTHIMFVVKGDDFFLMPYLTLRFWHQGSWVLSPKNCAGVFVFGSLPVERRLRLWILLSGGRRHNCGRGLKHTPLANFKYAWLHRRLQHNIQRSKKNSLTEDFEDVQDNEIAVLDSSQEADKVLTRSSKPVPPVSCTEQFCGLRRFWSDGLMDVTCPCGICHDSWIIQMCDMTHSYVSHDSFICVTWLIHTCDMTHSYVSHD